MVLLRIASGAPEPLAAAAAGFGEPAPRVLDAARFYLQQALFFPGADAYRLLAASPGSDAGTLREHHRLLQAWLHPDRGGEEWGTRYAARVNAAWSQLRDQTRREAYASHSTGAPAMATAGQGRRAVAWRAVPGDASRAWWPAIALALAVFACIGLLFLNQRARQAGGFETAADQPLARDARATERVALSALARTVRDVASLARKSEAEPETTTPPRDQPSPREPAASVAIARIASHGERHAPAPRPAEPTARPEPLAIVPASMASTSPSPPVAPSSARVEPGLRMPAPSPTPPDAALARFGKAIAFLSARRGVPPPIWNDLAALDDAQSIHDRLRACYAAGAMRVSPAAWEIDGRMARAVAPYRLSRADGVVQAGIVRVELRARDGDWWVSGVRMEPQP